ncbi:MAG: hypothetical protein J6X59_00290 [Bacteroidales bacterium]|nr:hypothetical protein [Bacteroidales bacterium]
MKANELMIGDWVRCTDPNPFKIEQIDGVEEQCYGDDGFWVDTRDLRPIPLTAEILEKNGFEELMSEAKGVAAIFGRKVEHTGVWMYRIPDTFDSVSYVPERKLLHLKVMEGGIIDLHNFQYVHELQHFLRLCGIEKEVVL